MATARGDDPTSAARNLVTETGADLPIALDTFAKREFIQAMTGDRIRAMKEPTSLEQLRSQMTSIIVRDLFSDEPRHPARAGTTRTPRCTDPSPSPAARLEPSWRRPSRGSWPTRHRSVRVEDP
jgi:hypothetical protein